MALQPLVAICGTTGVGKSRLAVELALEICGKVINADAMQIYQGLDILTNKLRKEEQRGVEHVLMDFKRPEEQYVIGEWLQDARSEIDKARSEGKIPIVVGGTSYWIHHLLFPNSLPAQAGPSKHCSTNVPLSTGLSSALKKLPEDLTALFGTLPACAPSAKTNPDDAFALYTLLSHLDPLMAGRWHWKDTRKILRNLEIIKENGRLASEVVAEAHSSAADSRSYQTLILWLYANPDVLNPRLEQRVDQILSDGLLDEIRSMRRNLNRPSGSLDFTTGVFQSIGLREFYDYLDREGDERAYALAVAEMKLNTIKYARRQVKWIRNKLLPTVATYCSNNNTENSSKAYLLDATDLSAWDEQVLANAKRITTAFVSGSDTPDPASLSATASKLLSIAPRSIDPADVMLARRKIICRTCTTEPNRPVMLEEGPEWEAHQRTSAHRRMLRKQLQQDRECDTQT